MSTLLDLPGVFHTAFVQWSRGLVEDKLGETQDGVERRPQFVAHLRQEGRLGADGELRALFCQAQFDLGLDLLGYVVAGAAVAEKATGVVKDRGPVDADVPQPAVLAKPAVAKVPK